MSQPKDLAKKAHQILKDQGHAIPLGHIYEMLAKLSGAKDWNTAKVLSPDLSPIISALSFPESGEQRFCVRVRHGDANCDDIELTKEYHVFAPDAETARQWVQEYVLFASGDDKYWNSKLDKHGGIDINLVKDPRVRRMIEVDLKDDAESFEYQDWKLTSISGLDPKVCDVWQE